MSDKISTYAQESSSPTKTVFKSSVSYNALLGTTASYSWGQGGHGVHHQNSHRANDQNVPAIPLTHKKEHILLADHDDGRLPAMLQNDLNVYSCMVPTSDARFTSPTTSAVAASVPSANQPQRRPFQRAQKFRNAAELEVVLAKLAADRAERDLGSSRAKTVEEDAEDAFFFSDDEASSESDVDMLLTDDSEDEDMFFEDSSFGKATTSFLANQVVAVVTDEDEDAFGPIAARDIYANFSGFPSPFLKSNIGEQSTPIRKPFGDHPFDLSGSSRSTSRLFLPRRGYASSAELSGFEDSTFSTDATDATFFSDPADSTFESSMFEDDGHAIDDSFDL